MDFIIVFIILGTISYLLIQNSAAKATKTPIWLLWLALMSPAFIWTTWKLIYTEDQAIPQIILIIPLFLSPLLYLWLIEIGKPTPEEKEEKKGYKKEEKEEYKKDAPNNLDLLEEKEQVRPITNEEEKELRDCFPWGIYYLQKIDYLPQIILCTGKLRTVPENAYKTIKKNIEKVFNDRFLLIFQETLQGQPFFALIPNPHAKSNQAKIVSPSEKLTRPQFALGLLLLTFITTTIVGTGFTLTFENTDTSFYNALIKEISSNPSLLLQGLPYSLSLIGILGVHELSHYLVSIYYRIRTTLPYFIPFPLFLGTFGAFISVKSPTPHRKALFDVAIAGPLGGLLVTIPVLVWGFAFSDVVNLPEATTTQIFNFETLDPRFSCLLAILSKLALGSHLIPGKGIALHPMAIAGYIGLIITALNLMPVGQLDGGHTIHAMFGQGKGILIGQITRFLMFGFALVRQEFLFWAIILLFMPLATQPALNDVTELNNWRDFLGLMCLVLLIFILLPLPPTVALWLNI